jgi:hypothetical protein
MKEDVSIRRRLFGADVSNKPAGQVKFVVKKQETSRQAVPTPTKKNVEVLEVKDTKHKKKLRYDVGFLLSIRHLPTCKEPLSGLIAEIAPQSGKTAATIPRISKKEIADQLLDSVLQSPTDDLAPATPEVPKEWRQREKKEKARETDEKRIAARIKQLEIGYSTPGYQRYCQLTPE